MIAARHIVVGVSHPSDDPTRHRVFEICAIDDGVSGGWIADVDEQNANAQPDRWSAWQAVRGRHRPFPTAAACLGHAVELIVATVAHEAVDERGKAANRHE